MLWLSTIFAFLAAAADADLSPPAQIDWPPGLSVRGTAMTDLGTWLSQDTYRAIPIADLKRLLPYSETQRVPDPVADQPSIARAVYSGTLQQPATLSGTLSFELDDRVVAERGGLIDLGTTSLQNLAFDRNGEPLQPGSDQAGRFFVRVGQGVSAVHGTWSASGSTIGASTVFRIDLPRSTVCELRLATPADVTVTCNNALVLGPAAIADQPDRQQLTWTLLPNAPGRITVSCRASQADDHLKPLVLNSITASHAVSGDTLQSRWTVALAQSGTEPIILTCRLPVRVRVTDIRINESIAPEWSATEEAGLQTIRLTIPRWSGVTTVAIQAASVLSDRSTITVPFLTPERWFSPVSSAWAEGSAGGADHRGEGGAVLFPASTVTLTIPPSMRLEDWDLEGVVERDVTVVPDGTQTFQLTRVDPSASALAHVAVAEPQIEDSLLALLHASDRSSTVRCLVHVRCRNAATVQLDWPVAAGWRPLAARYASNSRLLYFEHLPAADGRGRSSMVVHLAEALEPDASRILELEFQQFDGTGSESVSLPLLASPNYSRRTSALVSDLDRSALQSLLRRLVTPARLADKQELMTELSWVPKTAIPDDAGGILWDGSDLVFRAGDEQGVADQTGGPDLLTPPVIRLQYSASLADATVVETTELLIPREMDGIGPDRLLLQTAARDETTLTCTINGIVAEITAAAVDDSSAEWQRWTVALPVDREQSDLRVMVTVRRPARTNLPAAIVYPGFDCRIEGTGEVSTASGQLIQLSTSTILPPGSTAGISFAGNADETTVYSLPTQPEQLSLTITDPVASLHPGRSIHVWHLLRTTERLVLHRSLAVIDLPGDTGQTSIPLRIALDSVLSATVNGKDVRILNDGGVARLPVPRSDSAIRICVLWDQETALPFRGTQVSLELPVDAADGVLASHSLLVDTGLVASPPQGLWTSPGMVATESLLREAIPQLTGSQGGPHPLQTFVSDWRLSVASSWQPLSAAEQPGESRLQLPLNGVRWLRLVRTSAAAVAACLAFVLLRSGGGRLLACLLLMAAIATRTSTTLAHVQWAASGIFWGTTAVLLWTICRRTSHPTGTTPSNVALQVAAVLLFAVTALSAPAQPPAAPAAVETAADILIPTERIEGIPLAYVRESLLDDWNAALQSSTERLPSHLILDAETTVRIQSPTNIAAELRMTVDVRSDLAEQWLRIIARQANLQSCRVDGRAELPVRTVQPDGSTALAVPLSPGVIVQPRPLLSPAVADRSAASRSQIAAEGQPNWKTRTVVLSFRPTVVSAPDGIRFELPSPPCPKHRIRFEVDPQQVHSALVESGDGFLVWQPGSDSGTSLQATSDQGFRVTLRTADRPVDTRTAAASCAAISELISGQHTITLLFQLAGLDPATSPMRIRVPDGYRVSAVAPSQPPEVQWTVKDRVIRLPNAVSALAGRVLAIQLVRDLPSEPEHHTIDLSQIIRDTSIPVADPVLLAVRTLPEMIVQSVESDGMPIPGAAQIPTDFATFIRRTDLLFEVSADSTPVLVRQTLRKAVSEARIRHEVDLQDETCNIRIRADIETSVQFVFRHSLKVSPEIVISNVGVTAGEANRLQSWTQRGDLLVVQLKEATSGLHNLTIQASLPVPDPGRPLPIRPPEWLDVQVLESDLILTDNSRRGFRLEELGAAVPEEPMEPGTPLPRDTAIRMQVVAESDPLVVSQIPAPETDSVGNSPAASEVSATADEGTATTAADASASGTTDPASDTPAAPAVPELPAATGRSVLFSLIGMSDNQAAYGTTHLIAFPAGDTAAFSIVIPPMLRVLDAEGTGRIQATADGDLLLVPSDPDVVEVTLHWVVPGTSRVPLWFDSRLTLPHVPGMPSSHLVSVTAPTTLRDNDGSLINFRSTAPELTGIELDSRLRLSLSQAMSSAAGAEDLSDADDAVIARLLAGIDAVRREFLEESQVGPGVPPTLRHFRLAPGNRFEAQAIRIPGMLDLVTVLLTMTLTGIVSLLEVKRRRRDRAAPAETRTEPIAEPASMSASPSALEPGSRTENDPNAEPSRTMSTEDAPKFSVDEQGVWSTDSPPPDGSTETVSE